MTPIALSVIVFVLAVLAALTGLAWIAVPLFVVAGIALIWGVVVLARGETRTPVLHRTQKAELLGPGGPDDPDA